MPGTTGETMPEHETATRSVSEARTRLERLQDETAAAEPYQLVSTQHIERLHESLESIAGRPAQEAYRLDGLSGINMRYLHQRVTAVLEAFDGLVSANPPAIARDA
jgi:hypothetical protein